MTAFTPPFVIAYIVLLLVSMPVSADTWSDNGKFIWGGPRSITAVPHRKLNAAETPDHEPPVILNGTFTEPSGAWRVNGGHLIAYDGGEWGGGLFFLKTGKDQLIRLIDGHISTCAIIQPSIYIVAGGLAHGAESGAVYRIWIDETLNWKTKQILHTRIGIPQILGMTSDNKIRVAIIQHPLNGEDAPEIVKGLFDVNSSGDLELLDSPTSPKR